MPDSVGDLLQIAPICADSPEVIAFVFFPSPTEKNESAVVGEIAIQDLTRGRGYKFERLSIRIVYVPADV